ncbi:MAG: hypothetical protein OQJ83_00520 [Altibacter sp.]|nr:hypothetical protein [Altibacter sp.]MCW8979839.1 hypothetical protein [Altibacter sp.]MCW9037106.1 hypothetical protein [Altibacter sp.]
MKTMKNIAAMFAVLTAVTFASCSSNDDTIPVDDDPAGSTDLTGNLTEDRVLDPSVEYSVTGPFLVKSGVKLTIPAGTVIVSEVGQDRYIAVEKGAEIDIQGTSTLPVIMRSENNAPGDWGGLLLCGNAVTTEGVDATAEVGGLIYGGTNNNDSSGNIDYLIIQGAGAQINSESQYNGLTLYAVGSGTTIDNVALIDGADDGVEFFGGTVSVNNLYLENNEDDAVDWTEGWSGTVTNTYVLHTIEGFSTAVEADGVNGNPKLVNFTAFSSTGGTALQFKKESGATITGLSLTGYETSIDMRDNGPLSNVIIDGEIGDPNTTYIAPPTVDVSMFAWVNSNQSGSEFAILEGNVTTTVTLDPAQRYLLNNAYIVQNGGKLIIPAGTKITARDGGTEVYIAVLKGGAIEINGTSSNPVVMSSQSAQSGDWGGLTICGDAPTTEGVNATAEVGGFIYGGNNPNDNSGNIDYLVILGTGAQINSESQYNGVSLYAVGDQTSINNLAVINGADDGIEFFGGTVNATNLYFENNEDDSVDWTEGWNGTVTNTYVLHAIEGFSTAIEADGINNNPTFTNFTAISSTGGTALQFKKESGATMTNVLLTGYSTNVDMRDNGPIGNVIIDGVPLSSPVDDVFSGTAVDISGWAWINARL